MLGVWARYEQFVVWGRGLRESASELVEMEPCDDGRVRAAYDDGTVKAPERDAWTAGWTMGKITP